ncbi:hypothetical protein, partial [Bacillus subtilis]|uniref:hypothetical protein n=1 Tax=Bacillus subtilis TaxID=1423 RepID=UPI00338E1CE3
MNPNQPIIPSLSYFTLFIPPIILPILPYFLLNHKQTKPHAIPSLISHILPFLPSLFLFIPLLPPPVAIDGDSLLPVFVI